MAQVTELIRIEPDQRLDPTTTRLEYAFFTANGRRFLTIKNRGSASVQNRNTKQKFQIEVELLTRILSEINGQ